MGLRESKKRQTRQEIADRAMQLFATRGFDHVTVAEVADAASVSDKTVFNYFPTKEDLFWDEVPARQARLVDAIRQRGPGESIPTALRRMQAGDLPRLSQPEFAIFARIIEESPALQAKELAVMAQLSEALAEAIRSELAVSDLDAQIAANLLVAAHWQLFRNARRQALEGRHGRPALKRLLADLDRAYVLLQNGLGELEHGD